MEAVVECPPLAGGLFNTSMMNRTIRVQRVGFGRSSMSDVLGILKQNRIRHEDVEGFAVGDEGVSVTFTKEETSRLVLNLKYNGKDYKILNYGKQLVGIKIHWLPVFVAESCVRAILAPYGKVLSVERLKSKLGDIMVNNGQWFATMELDEVGKNNLPHLFKFACGSKALLTVRGRPPLCLRCHKVGHMRNFCDGYETRAQSYHEVNRSFAQVVSGERDDPPEMDEELREALAAREAAREARKAEEEARVDQVPPEEAQESVEEEIDRRSEGESERSMEEGEIGAGVRGEKRPSDESEEIRDSFDVYFPPNRPAKKPSRKTGGSSDSGSEGVQVNNSFSILAEFADSPAVE